MKNKTVKYSVLLSILFFTTGCGETVVSTIPDYPVNFEMNLVTEYNTFNSPGQVHYFDKRRKETDRIGYGGLIVCVNYEGRYMAFDLACPYEAKSDVRAYPDAEGSALTATCSKCGSTFNIYDDEYARPQSGPATQGLKKYQTAITSSGILRIYR